MRSAPSLVVLAAFLLACGGAARGCAGEAAEQAAKQAAQEAAQEALRSAAEEAKAAAELEPAGRWVEELRYEMEGVDAAWCAERNGSWSGSKCILARENTVEFGPPAAGIWPLQVRTVAPTGGTCDFAGYATREGAGFLASSPDEPACRVAVTPRDGALDVDSAGSCSYFCGASAELAVSGARRR